MEKVLESQAFSDLKQMFNVTNDDAFNDSIGTLVKILSMDDEELKLIKPQLLQMYQQNLSTAPEKIAMAQLVNSVGGNLEEVKEMFNQVTQELDNFDEISDLKKDFLKEIFGALYNSIASVNGIAKQIISVPIELCREDAKIPTYATIHDAGADVYATEDYNIDPGETKIIPLGIKIALPPGYAFLIHPRSGLSAKTKMRVANSIGLCDAGYRDEYGVIIENIEPKIKDITVDEEGKVTSILYGSPLHISKGQRIAQLRLVEVPKADFYSVNSVQELGEDRGGGFGSSGE